MSSQEKDIILIVGSGGMAGIFSSGVLEAFEDEAIRDRIDSVYAVSVGGCIAARFLLCQSALGAQTFFTRFSDDHFLKKHFARYFFQAIRRRFSPRAHIDELFDFNYFTDVILSSEDRIDMHALVNSPIPFFVKVFNNTKNVHEYIPVREPRAYQKVLASASMTPITSQACVLDGMEYFDGETIASDSDLRIAKENPDKIVVRTVNARMSLLARMNPLVPLIVYILFACLYSFKAANRYLRAYFKQPILERELRRQSNVLTIESDLRTSSFCKDTDLLQKAYQDGLRKGSEAAQKLNESSVLQHDKGIDL